MSVLNFSGDESPECPLCMELLELDDINFYPCACGYQICRFCWNKLRTEGNGLCPACRQAYSENPADFKPLTTEEIAKIRAEKRQKDQAKKLKITENRKHLANVRVVQKNLVFVVGLSPRLAEPDILKKTDYFGKFGRIQKVVINHSTQYAGSQVQGPSASAYVTYYKSDDALRAIQAVNNIYIDGRTLKASLGTTKYCSHFMKNQTCPKNDCMYLHELGDEAASFTKEEMQQGKHTEYEKQLHDDMLSGLGNATPPTQPPEIEEPPPPLPVSNAGDLLERSEQGDTSWPDLTNHTNNSKPNLVNNTEQDSAEPSEEEQIIEPQIVAPIPQIDPGDIPSSPQPPQPPPPIHTSQGWFEIDDPLDDPDSPEEDDLGFDPFHETQKGLADLIESENKAAEAISKQAMATSHGDWKQQPSKNSLSAAAAVAAASRPRAPAPPPGFHTPAAQPSPFAGLLPDNCGNLLPPPGAASAAAASVNSLYSSGGAGGSRLNSRLGLSGGVGYGLSQGAANHTEHLFQHSLSAGAVNTQDHSKLLFESKQQVSTDLFGNKDWQQDGLRALFPNANVSFGLNNSLHTREQQLQQQLQQHQLQQQLQQQQQPSHQQLQQQQLQHQQQQQLAGQSNFFAQDRLQPNLSSWSGLGMSNSTGQDWTAMDPAIVGGQLANPGAPGGGGAADQQQSQIPSDFLSGALRGDLIHGGGGLRPESPNTWLTANLEQITSEPYQNLTAAGSNQLLSAFGSFSLDRNGPLLGGRNPNTWGDNSSTPPPGFGNLRRPQYYPGSVTNKISEP
jgi:CCR4-NOT transcription complex subunit 4